MAFNWAEYLNLAQALAAPGAFNDATISEEAIVRCVVSRAYYAAFCHARNHARDRHGLQLRYTGDDHFLVRQHFLTRRERGVAGKLDLLRQWRNKCDYEDSLANLDKLLASALQEAGLVIAILK